MKFGGVKDLPKLLAFQNIAAAVSGSIDFTVVRIFSIHIEVVILVGFFLLRFLLDTVELGGCGCKQFMDALIEIGAEIGKTL